jgi:P27 family predicted phage terminase small subunit
MRGRKPKPTHLRVVGGNAGRRPLNQHEPSPNRGLPTAPRELTEDARLEWRRVSRRLHEIGLLTVIDRAALAAYCQVYGRWIAAERALAAMAERDPVTQGLLIKTSNGNAIQNPLVGIANKAMADMVRYATEFGLTPSARSRVKAEPPVKNVDPAEKFFG